MTQSDIEDVLVFAAQKGISVLKIGVPKDVLAEYNRSIFGASVVLEGSSVANYQRAVKPSGIVQIVALEE